MSACFQADGLCAAYGDGRVCTLSAICESGSIVRLGGPSGSGKTTMLRTIARLRGSAGGAMRLDGRDSSSIDPVAWRAQVAFVAQRPTLLPGTIGDNLSIGFILKARKGASCDGEGVQALCDALYLPSDLLTQDARSASGGESARVALIRALVTEPQVLLLDETTAPLDPEAATAVIETVASYVQQGNRCAIFVAHQPEPWHAVMTDTVEIGTVA